jgi:outer membrane biogenesis lipoprotein LolB
MKQIIILFAALLLSACTTEQSNKDRDKESSGPTVYGQINMSVDHVSVH